MRRIDFVHTTAVDTSISASEFFPLAMRSFGALLRSIVLDANFLANHVLTNILFHYLVLDALVALLLDALLELLHEALLALLYLYFLHFFLRSVVAKSATSLAEMTRASAAPSSALVTEAAASSTGMATETERSVRMAKRKIDLKACRV